MKFLSGIKTTKSSIFDAYNLLSPGEQKETETEMQRTTLAYSYRRVRGVRIII
jgi:hypothetical protein